MKCISNIIYIYAKFVWKTTKWEFIGKDKLIQTWQKEGSIILIGWHGRMPMMPLLRTFIPQKKMNALVSLHNDGQLIAHFLKKFNIGIIGGSSNNFAKGAALNLMKSLQNNEAITIIPDGPRGPRMKMSMSPIYYAHKTGKAIFSITYSTNKAKIIEKAWDKMLVPFPFGKGIYYMSEPFYVPQNIPESELENYRKKLEDIINNNTIKADKEMGTARNFARHKHQAKTLQKRIKHMFMRTYNLLIRIMYPLVIKRYINKRKEIGKEDVKRFNERIGRPSIKRPEGKLIWMHGASVGESVSMLPLIHKLLETYPDLHIMVTTGTVTSADIMAKRLPERAFHQYIPIDNPVFVTRFIKHWMPDLVLWFESEFWPALLSGIKRKKIPFILINGRISNKSFKKWQQFDFISKELLGCFTMCLGQSEEDAYRLRKLGAKVSMCLGNIKYAGINPPVDENKLSEIQGQIGNRPNWTVSSTHHDEEAKIGRFLVEFKNKFPSLITIIAPRHPQRGPEIQDTLNKLGLKTALRSVNEQILPATDVYIADTIGEVGIWYTISPLVFMGGSLIPHGGQNFIEPSRFRDAVIVGPHMHNFTDAMNRAKKSDAIMQVNDVLELQDLVAQLLENKELLEAKRSLAYNWSTSEAKVLDGIVEKVKGFI